MIKILMLSLCIIFFSNYAMEDMDIAGRVFQETLIQEIIPRLCFTGELSCNESIFNVSLKRFSDPNFSNKSLVRDENNKDRLVLLGTFEDTLENFSSVQSLMLVNKKLYLYIKKMYIKSGLIATQYRNIAFTLKQYYINRDVHWMVMTCFTNSPQSQIALEQLTIISNHKKTLEFFGCIDLYIDSKIFDYSNLVGCLMSWLIFLNGKRRLNFLKHTPYFKSVTQYELILTKIIKNVVSAFASGSVIECKCPSYTPNCSMLLHPEIIVMYEGPADYWNYLYRLTKS